MKQGGWTKRHRRRWESKTFRASKGHVDGALMNLADYLIDLANVSPEPDLSIPGHPIIGRGECRVRYAEIATVFGWSKARVSERIALLEERQFLKRRTVPERQIVVVSLCGYERYQSDKAPVPNGSRTVGGTVTGTVPGTVGGTGFIIEEVKKERLKDGGSGLRAAAVPDPPREAEKSGETEKSPWDEMIPLRRGAHKPPPPCPRCKKPLSYFETRSGSRYAADRWYCDEKAEGCGGKFPEVEWEDPGEGKPLRRRKKEWRSKTDQHHRPELKPIEVSERFLPPIPHEGGSRES